VKEQALAKKLPNWNPPYIWIIYGMVGMRKTRSIITFPPPLRIFDFDIGTEVIKGDLKSLNIEHTIHQYNSEECDDYAPFLKQFEAYSPKPNGGH